MNLRDGRRIGLIVILEAGNEICKYLPLSPLQQHIITNMGKSQLGLPLNPLQTPSSILMVNNCQVKALAKLLYKTK